MKIKNLSIVTLCFLLLNISDVVGQFELTGQYKARAEFLNGYQEPLLKTDDPGFYIHQRARLGGKYTHERFRFNLTVQDVRTWGNSSHLAIDNNGYLSLFEANLELFLHKNWALKIGRQQIAYDNDRILGTLDWAMQARRHDAAILKFRDSTWSVDIGATYNQARPSNKQIFYELNDYKTFQYVWANKKWNDLSVSLLFLNNGMEQIYFEDSVKKAKTRFTQTMGTHIKYTKDKFDLIAYGYYQMGVTQDNRTLSAYNASIAGVYKPTKEWSLTLGGDILSGTSQEATVNDRNSSFTPLYGTNHVFNGFMDYFYVSNHMNNVGLIDGYLKANYKKGKFGVGLANHLFFSEAAIQSGAVFFQPGGFHAANPFLGYEMDLTFTYQFVDEIGIQVGYSQLFGTHSMHLLKGTDGVDMMNWAYVMITANPFKNLKFGK